MKLMVTCPRYLRLLTQRFQTPAPQALIRRTPCRVSQRSILSMNDARCHEQQWLGVFRLMVVAVLEWIADCGLATTHQEQRFFALAGGWLVTMLAGLVIVSACG